MQLYIYSSRSHKYSIYETVDTGFVITFRQKLDVKNGQNSLTSWHTHAQNTHTHTHTHLYGSSDGP